MKNTKNGDAYIAYIWTIVIVFALVLILVLGFGFKQKMAKNFGGSMTVELAPNTKLLNATWKNNSLWLLTSPRIDEKPTTYNFIEKTSMGILQGNVIIVEK